MKKTNLYLSGLMVSSLFCLQIPLSKAASTLPDTNQNNCYDTNSAVITCPSEGQAFHGQDSQYQTNTPSYTDNGDGTTTDNITGLMWQQSLDVNGDGTIDANDMQTWDEVVSGAESLTLADHNDWRIPTVKELYSLIDFNGATGFSALNSLTAPSDAIPYINTDFFNFAYGDSNAGYRYIDAQLWTATDYVSTTMDGNATNFGVNFADGRIKGYPLSNPRYIRYVRGNSYGANSFIDNGDTTITDNNSNLMWLQNDSGSFETGYSNTFSQAGSLDWEEALSWCEGLTHANYSDWRLPNAKELQGLVDYTRSPDTTNSAAIDPLFTTTLLTNGINNSLQANYPYHWTSTTHLDGIGFAVYIAFGEARGHFATSPNSDVTLLDVHGAGSQRSDPKSGDPTSEKFINGHGPQGDIVSIYNYARCVRDANTSNTTTADSVSYDSNASLLEFPVVDAGDLGIFNVSMRLMGINSAYTPGYIFELETSNQITANVTASASFDTKTNIVSIPVVKVGTESYGAKMIMITDSNGKSSFIVNSLETLVSE